MTTADGKRENSRTSTNGWREASPPNARVSEGMRNSHGQGSFCMGKARPRDRLLMTPRNSMTAKQMRARAALCLKRAETAPDLTTASDYRMVATRLLWSANELEQWQRPPTGKKPSSHK